MSNLKTDPKHGKKLFPKYFFGFNGQKIFQNNFFDPNFKLSIRSKLIIMN